MEKDMAGCHASTKYIVTGGIDCYFVKTSFHTTISILLLFMFTKHSPKNVILMSIINIALNRWRGGIENPNFLLLNPLL
jgi:hypothetical protein